MSNQHTLTTISSLIKSANVATDTLEQVGDLVEEAANTIIALQHALCRLAQDGSPAALTDMIPLLKLIGTEAELLQNNVGVEIERLGSGITQADVQPDARA